MMRVILGCASKAVVAKARMTDAKSLKGLKGLKGLECFEVMNLLLQILLLAHPMAFHYKNFTSQMYAPFAVKSHP
jgi:hypothetical protein